MLSEQNNIGRTIIPYMNKKGKNTSGVRLLIRKPSNITNTIAKIKTG